MIFKKSRRDSPGFFAGLAPSNSVSRQLPQQSEKSLHSKQLLE
jgi:hypothetical protein